MCVGRGVSRILIRPAHLDAQCDRGDPHQRRRGGDIVEISGVIVFITPLLRLRRRRNDLFLATCRACPTDPPIQSTLRQDNARCVRIDHLCKRLVALFGSASSGSPHLSPYEIVFRIQ